MKILQAHVKNDQDMGALDVLGQIQPNFVLAFGGVKFFEDGQLGKTLRQKFPQATVIGCSSAGEIVDDAAVYDDTLVVTALADLGMQAFLATAPIGTAADSYAAGQNLGKDLTARGVASVFVLAPGLGVNGSDLAGGFASVVDTDVVVTGGLAGDGTRFQKTYTLFNETVSSDTVVAVGFKGEALKVTYGSAGGWEPFGPERKVTRAVSNVLYELDGKSALQLYKEYLGEKAKDLPASGLLYPFSVLRDNVDPSKGDPASNGLVRSTLCIDEKEGSLILAGDIEEGCMVRLMHAKSNGLVKGAALASAEATATVQGGDNLGILISCVGRKVVMGLDVDDEVAAVKETFGPKSVITGFYSYGEICAFDQMDRKPCLHNQTMTVTRMERGD
ncbi:MAG: FIST N-terminal domain-containing protein [Alphaproteobacteria bacterium]|nr:FIST N-terminal domain-containing protein [Alphaproteobacteria bacterium]